MKRIITPFLCLILGVVLPSGFLLAQKQLPLDIALRHLEQNREQWLLSSEDIADLVVSDQYVTRHNGLTHVYVVQRYNGIELHNAVNGFHISNQGEVVYATNRFMPKLTTNVNATSPSISPEAAVMAAIHPLDVTLFSELRLLSQEDNKYVFDKANVARQDIEVELKYLPNQLTGDITLVWNVVIDQINTSDYWSIRIDALTGEEVDRHNYTLYCGFHEEADHQHDYACKDDLPKGHFGLKTLEEAFAQEKTTTLTGGTYNVFPVPVESPIHGDRELVENPADAEASPFGWHDTNFEEGAEYTITRGNNVHAYLDLDADNTSNGDEPDGGDELIFDFLYNDSFEPDTVRDMAVTQLFYMNNIMHDFTWHFGFDEASGNFQATNSGVQGSSGDYVLAEAQDGGGTNNANFATPPDGGNGRMQMFLWTNSANQLLTGVQPLEVVGGYSTGVAGFGPQVDENFEPVQGLVIDAFDATGNPTLSCETIINDDEVNGKIALIDRGVCFFQEKALNAEEAGAIGVIICNFQESIIAMGEIAGLAQPTIPTLMLKNSDCLKLRQFIDQGVEVRIALPDITGPEQLDGDFDNGIIAHEYGHGISNRLTGGPNQAGCLTNDEQMGEGWSDYFSLITTVEDGDTGEMPRGIGTFALGQETTGGGIRRLPYSTDMNINDQTYDDIIGTGAPHPLGEIWSGVTWDLYWALVDEYGYDADYTNADAGNNIAIQLVMDGMKLQSCSPGLIDGRDGILAADQANYGGANECLIWDVFARRGLGFSADQGFSNNRNDNREAFDPRPECIKELKITKSSTSNVEPGSSFQIVLEIRNDKEETATNVEVIDALPEGLTYESFVAPGGVTAALINGGNDIQFNLGDLESGQSIIIFYTVTAAEEFRSNLISFEGAEEDESSTDTWVFETSGDGEAFWSIVDTNAFSGLQAYFVPNEEGNNDQRIVTLFPIELPTASPVLRFAHSYDTEVGFDGGIVQISTNGLNWTTLENDQIFREPYRGGLAYGTFAIPNLNAFWGNSSGYVETYIDLSDYAGQNVFLRFRFGSDEQGSAFGWYVDDIEIIDMFNYNSTACVTSNEGDNACTTATERGTVVEPSGVVNTNDPLPAGQVTVFPNPAHDLLQVAYEGDGGERLSVFLMGVDGRILRQDQRDAVSGLQTIELNVNDIPAGLYLLQVQTPMGMHTEKVSIQ